MTTKPAFNRADFVRQRRTSRTPGSTRTSQPSRDKKPRPATPPRRPSYRPETLYLPIEPRVRRDPQPARRTKQARNSSRTQHYDIAFSLGRADVRAPAISLPRLDFSSTRWISGLLTIILAGMLFLMWNTSTFIVSAADVVGNQRIGADEISAVLGIVGEPVFKAVPAQIEANLRTAYPDLAGAHVRVRFPNHVIVEVVERMPVLAWFQNNAMTWIDANGVAFTPRGEVPGLVQVAANGAPLQVQNDPTTPVYEQRFINPDMVQVISGLAPYVPAGMPMIYDPQYGIGWQEPRGWVVYFGQNTRDIPMKLTIYQPLVERLISQGIQPTLISMEYLDAPFYK
jgi:cell division protein FtsQ